jgi:hypothetical protein
VCGCEVEESNGKHSKERDDAKRKKLNRNI